jgi:hypothetical protein
MSHTLNRLLKIAAAIQDSEDYGALDSFCTQCEAFFKKHAHMVPHNDGTTPNPWRRNMDYSEFDRSPYYGSVSEFMEKFPGGIREWVEWRNKSKKDRFKRWDIKKASMKKEAYSERALRDLYLDRIVPKVRAIGYDNLSEDQTRLYDELETLMPEIGDKIEYAYNVGQHLLEDLEINVSSELEKTEAEKRMARVTQLTGIIKNTYYEPVGGDDVEKFENEPHLYSDEGLEKFKSVKEYVEKRRKALGQAADDAALSAVKDFIAYWKLLLKGKEKRKKARKGKGRK